MLSAIYIPTTLICIFFLPATVQLLFVSANFLSLRMCAGVR